MLPTPYWLPAIQIPYSLQTFMLPPPPHTHTPSGLLNTYGNGSGVGSINIKFRDYLVS